MARAKALSQCDVMQSEMSRWQDCTAQYKSLVSELRTSCAQLKRRISALELSDGGSLLREVEAELAATRAQLAREKSSRERVAKELRKYTTVYEKSGSRVVGDKG